MNRFPLNSLLWLVAVGLAGGSGWQFWQALQEKSANTAAKTSSVANEAFDRCVEAGKSRAGKVAVGPNYAEPKAFWDSFVTANFIGKEPPKPVVQDAQPVVDTTPKPPVLTPLDDLFVIAVLVSAGPDSRAVVRYKPGANVTPPPDAVPPASGADAVAAPSPAGGPRPVQPFPTAGDGLGPVHHLMIGDRLWKPHDSIKLLRVDASGEFAVFVREDTTKPESEWKQEEVDKAVLELPASVLKKLREGLNVAVSRNEVRDERPSDGEGTQPAGAWQGALETGQREDGRWHIGTNDRESFRADPRVFTERLGTQSWRSQSGSMSGVRITRVPPELRGYGISDGEIIIAINGEAVTGKTEAIRLGRQLYDRGVRVFDVTFLSQGRQVTRSYVAPDDK
ncbi:MAG: hypothetical protein IT457_10195 [Planctomycetes bacterium]|nr:hypothetical protein [Planctomycetota bacterium]